MPRALQALSMSQLSDMLLDAPAGAESTSLASSSYFELEASPAAACHAT